MGDALPAVDLGEGVKALRVEAGISHTCAITSGGVKCWGGADGGRLGLGDTESRSDQPGEMGDALPFVDLGTGLQATALRLGAMHTCAILGAAGVKCWGDNYSGQLGLGDTKNRGDQPGEMGDALLPVSLETPDSTPP